MQCKGSLALLLGEERVWTWLMALLTTERKSFVESKKTEFGGNRVWRKLKRISRSSIILKASSTVFHVKNRFGF